MPIRLLKKLGEALRDKIAHEGDTQSKPPATGRGNRPPRNRKPPREQPQEERRGTRRQKSGTRKSAAGAADRDTQRDNARDNKRDTPRERDTKRDTKRETTRDRGTKRDTRRDAPRDNRRDTPRDAKRDASRDTAPTQDDKGRRPPRRRKERQDGDAKPQDTNTNRPSRSARRGGSRRSGTQGDRPDRAGSPAGEPRPAPAAPAPAAEAPAKPAEPWSRDAFQVPEAEGRTRFHDFDLPDEIMHAIHDLGFQYCTPIQAASLKQALAGANVAGRAQTGTGKTAAFLIAILTRYLRTPDGRADKPATPRALVLTPTRELCVQICNDARDLGKYCGLRSLAVFGGMDYNRQQRQLAEGPVDLLAATPGRLLDFQRQRVVDLSRVDTLVIDEADRMLDMGFIPDVRRIIRCLPDRDRRQTLLYSATLDDEVMRLAAQWMPNPVKIEVEPEHVASETIEQKVYIVTAAQKFTVLCNLLKDYRDERVLIFANRRISTERLAVRLRRQGIACELLSGDVQQTRRMRVLEDFRSGAVKIVVATDVAGRGLHIADIGLVVNFELPYEAEDYVHRIGRTGRAGKVGTAVSFACENESFQIPEIEEFLGEPLKCVQPDDALLAQLPAPGPLSPPRGPRRSSRNGAADDRGRSAEHQDGQGRNRDRDRDRERGDRDRRDGRNEQRDRGVRDRNARDGHNDNRDRGDRDRQFRGRRNGDRGGSRDRNGNRNGDRRSEERGSDAAPARETQRDDAKPQPKAPEAPAGSPAPEAASGQRPDAPRWTRPPRSAKPPPRQRPPDKAPAPPAPVRPIPPPSAATDPSHARVQVWEPGSGKKDT
jgi:ATP-dependent RNA helicase RhlB